MRTKKIVCAVTLSVSLLFSTIGASAIEYISFENFYSGDAVTTSTEPLNPEIDLALPAKSAILMEASTGRILYQSNEDEQLPLASVTKIMTLLLVMEDVEKGVVKLEDKVNITEHAMSMGGSQIWLKPGEDMTVNELLKATCVASANDAAMALAEHISGTEEMFVERMNAKSKELGMENTVFKNPTGLDAEGHFSSSKDIAIMSRELIKHPLILEYTTIWMDSLRGGETELVNTNKMVRFYEGCTGLKTGTTNGAGCCVSATAERDGLSLIAVVMGSATSAERFASATTLLDYGFSKYEMAEIPDFSEEYKTVSVKGGEKEDVGIEFQVQSQILVPKGQKEKMKVAVAMSEELNAPIEKVQTVGKVVVTVDETVIGEYPILTTEAVEKFTLISGFTTLFESLFHNA